MVPRSSFPVLIAALVLGAGASAASDRVEDRFDADVQPILEDYCASCHANGIKKGGVSFDGLDSALDALDSGFDSGTAGTDGGGWDGGDGGGWGGDGSGGGDSGGGGVSEFQVS